VLQRLHFDDGDANTRTRDSLRFLSREANSRFRMIRESVFSFVRRLTTWQCPRPRRSTPVAAAARLLLTAGPPVVQQSTDISYTLRSQQQTRRCGGRTGHTDGRPTVTQTLLCILCGQWQKEEMFAAIKMGGVRNVRGECASRGRARTGEATPDEHISGA